MTAIFVWRFSPYVVFFPWLIIACLDGTFLSSALTKVPSGAWFTITLAIVLASIFLVWRFGKEQQWKAEAEDRYPTSHFVRTGPADQLSLTEKFHADPLSQVKGVGIFFDKTGETTPIVFSQFIIKLIAVPEVIVFFHLRPLEQPFVAPEDRFSVSKLGVPNSYRIVVRYGYNDDVITPDLASIVHEKIHTYLTEPHGKDEQMATPSSAGSGLNGDADGVGVTSETLSSDSSPKRLAALDGAFAHKIIYIIGKEQMRVRPKTNYLRKFLLYIFLWIRENTRNKIANLNVPIDRVVEVGFLKTI